MKNEIQINSKRRYTIQISDNAECDRQDLTINRLINFIPNEYEYIYAAYEVIDDILDLKLGESIYFQPNRNDSNSKGIITRKQ